MKVALLCLFLSAACATPQRPSDEAADWYLRKSIDEFDKEFGIMVADEDEKAIEAERLKEVEAQINEQNEKFAKGEATFGEKLYSFSDLTKDEFDAEMLGAREWDPSRGDAPPEREMGLIEPPESMRNTPENQAKLDALYSKMADRQAPPSAYFSNSKGWVTKAKSQGNCGSCAAFGATGLHETCMLKAGAPHNGLDLAEQYIIDCGYDGEAMNGCKGAFPHSYTEFFANDGGVSPHEGAYPYLGKYPKLNCNQASNVNKWSSGAKVVDSVYDYGCDEEKLKQLVYEKGAVMVAIYASDDKFKGYDGKGVMNECSPFVKYNHAVLVVGYGRENGQDYWMVKNSWGSNWGLHGFIKLARGSNQCGIGQVCVVADCVASGRQEAVPTATTTTEAPMSMWCDVSKMYDDNTLTGTFGFRVKDKRTGEMIQSSVTCKNSMCTPAVPGPSNACIYICGAVTCD